MRLEYYLKRKIRYIREIVIRKLLVNFYTIIYILYNVLVDFDINKVLNFIVNRCRFM